MWAAVLLVWVVIPCSPVCYASFNIMRSQEECAFHYAADDPACAEYRFTHCNYYTNTTTYWLWVFRDEVRSHLTTATALQDCAAVCCKDNGTLPTGVEGYRLCQDRKFQQEVDKMGLLGLLVQVGVVLFLVSVVISILYAIYQSIEQHLPGLRAAPR